MHSPESHQIDDLLAGILPHVAFDGWSPEAFSAAVEECGLDREVADRLCKRGAIDLAVRCHVLGDERLSDALDRKDQSGLRYSQKVALAIETRLELAGDKEVVRRASSLFALPHLAVEGAGLIWGTADAIWTALGDTSDDFNWYSKRAILASVYGSTVLFWLGDTSNGAATTEFIERRIANVMQFEKFKADAKKSKVLGPLAQGFESFTRSFKAPSKAHQSEFPGYYKPQETK